MRSNTAQPNQKHFKRNTIIVIAVALVVTSIAGVLIWQSIFRNYAKEIAAPLEQSLIANGAVKMCESGDAGRGAENKEPHYTVRLQLNINKDEATKLINKVAKENGFTLEHQDSPYESIEWYGDNKSKDSPYKDLESGKIELSISTYSDTAKNPLNCLNQDSLRGDNTHTAVSLDVNLPNTKR